MTAPRTPKGGTRKTVFREVAQLRLEDAASLLKSKRFNGAIYLAGYAIECQLKFAVCERKRHLYLPGHLEIHGWDGLVLEAGLERDIKAQHKMAALYSALAEQWGPALRYETTKYSADEAARLYREIKELYQFFKELVR